MQFLIPLPLPAVRLSDEFAFSRVEWTLRVLFISGIYSLMGTNEQSLHSLIHMRYKPSCSS